MRAFWSRPRQDPVKFVYLTGDLSQVAEIKRVAGLAFELATAASSIDSALNAAVRTGARVLLTDAELRGFSWREVVAATHVCKPALAVVVVLDSFEGSEWADIIRNRAYDVLLRPLRKESFASTVSGAHLYATATGGGQMPANGTD